MPYVITVDASGPLATITAMLHQIDHFGRVGIGTEMSDWQVEDMHRHRPFTMRNRSQKKASTMVRPHSRYEVNRSRMAQRRIARRARRKSGPLAVAAQPQARTSTRPILRAELLVGFTKRMTEAMHEKLQWKKGSAKKV
jgi:hypothetical protein